MRLAGLETIYFFKIYIKIYSCHFGQPRFPIWPTWYVNLANLNYSQVGDLANLKYTPSFQSGQLYLCGVGNLTNHINVTCWQFDQLN